MTDPSGRAAGEEVIVRLGRDRAPRPSAAAWLGVATVVTSVLAGNTDRLPVPLPFNRIALALFLLATVRLVVKRGHRVGGIHVALFFQVIWIACSAALAGSLYTTTGLFAYVDEVVVPAALFFLAPFAFARRVDQVLLLKSITVLGGYMGFVSILQGVGLTNLVFPRYLAIGAVQGAINRAGGPFLLVGANGAALAMCLPVALLVAQIGFGRWRVPALLSALLCIGGGVMTLTRSVWLALVLSLTLFFLLDRRLRRVFPAALGSAVLFVVLLLGVVPGFRDAVLDRLGTGRSIDDRTTTNAAAVDMWREHPLTGIGWGRFLGEVNDYVRQLDLVPLTTTDILAHNVVLSRAAEVGSVGAGLFIATLLLGPLTGVVRRVSAGSLPWPRVLACLFASWLSVAMLTPMGYAFPNYLLWMVTGLCLSSAVRAPSNELRLPPRRAGLGRQDESNIAAQPVTSPATTSADLGPGQPIDDARRPTDP